MKNLLGKLSKSLTPIILGICLLVSIDSVNAGIMEGNPSGNITLVEFFDYTCPYCRAMNDVIDALMKNNPNVRVVYRPIPILHPESWFVASIAIAAQKQINYVVIHNALFNTREPLNENNSLKIAAHLGINTQRLLSDMKDPVVIQELQSNLKVAKELGVQQLPTIIIGKSQAKKPSVVFYGVTPLSQLQTAISQAEITHE